jgi:hypothetical protein
VYKNTFPLTPRLLEKITTPIRIPVDCIHAAGRTCRVGAYLSLASEVTGRRATRLNWKTFLLNVEKPNAQRGVRTFFWTYFGVQYPSGIAATLSFNTRKISG